ncbi:FAD-binding oxidoreductase [Leptolyngbya sp. FACHB-261]|uniref:FAD-binding oxidoreductase n=1 Tax=Leptolyngbya sp. FACHB-261 TaxID=2692806 RepID=UPI001689C48B|nr:FAD-binding oxidoreductase [Leptolyngbya sp. FACHB-261]MBD2103340.1 hypothetical protein [Leptolyngbya sp. FACHB-261]
MKPKPADYTALVLRSQSLTPTIKAVRLRLEDAQDFWFLPGQSLWPKLERDGRTFSKIYSIASSPSCRPEVEFCISRVGWSSAYLQDLEPGSRFKLRGPYGLMTLASVPDQPRLYLAEGSAIAPLKCQIDWLHEQGFDRPVQLVQANPETPDQLPYREHFEQLSQIWKHFNYVPVTQGSPEAYLQNLSLDISLASVAVEICAVGDWMSNGRRVDRSAEIQQAVLAGGANPEWVRTERFVAF